MTIWQKNTGRFRKIVDTMTGFAAGVLIFVVVEKLIPESSYTKTPTWSPWEH